jgi:hypothetical protein
MKIAKSPFIVNYIEDFTENDYAYIVLDYYEGGSLDFKIYSFNGNGIEV